MSAPGDNLPRPATFGPWGWFGWTKGPMYLATQRGGRVFVMTFRRLGMRDAQPCFQIDNHMKPASDLAVPERDYRDDIAYIDHPDARAIAALPEWIAAHDAEREGRLRAEARVRALEEALGEALEALREPRAEKRDTPPAAPWSARPVWLSRHGEGGGS